MPTVSDIPVWNIFHVPSLFCCIKVFKVDVYLGYWQSAEVYGFLATKFSPSMQRSQTTARCWFCVSPMAVWPKTLNSWYISIEYNTFYLSIYPSIHLHIFIYTHLYTHTININTDVFWRCLFYSNITKFMYHPAQNISFNPYKYIQQKTFGTIV